MSLQEGVIKFRLDFSEAAPVPDEEISEINAWRKILYTLGLIGRDPARYGGLGYGNVSRRIPPFDATWQRRAFLISGTQTGGVPDLTTRHYTCVRFCDVEANHIVAEGPARPSSEALTHGAVYAQDPDLHWVMHVHSPQIWQQAYATGLPVTSPQAAYGTPEMASEVRRLFRESDVIHQGLFAMGGHEDGIVAFGRTAQEAGCALLSSLAEAMRHF